MPEDYYDLLGVSRDASDDEIERAYREKAARNHPDVSDDPDAEERFKRLQEAKEVLTDEEKRRAYDRLGHERFEAAEKRGAFEEGAGGGGAGAAGRGGARSGGPFGAGGDPFGAGGVGDVFEEFFGGSAGRRAGRADRPREGTDLRTELDLDLDDAFEGVEKTVTVRRPERCDECGGDGYPPDATVRTCPECDGRGRVTEVRQSGLGRVQQTRTCRRCGGEGEVASDACPECGGDGRVRRETALSVEVPAGIRDGQTLRMAGEGAPGENGGPNGDLLIDVSVRDHPAFERDGDDLRRERAVSFPQAALGDTVEVETLDGAVELDVPAGTQSGERFRLDGRGMPRLEGRGRGDLYVTVRVVTPVPDDLTAEQREALERFAAASDEDGFDGGFFDRVTDPLT